MVIHNNSRIIYHSFPLRWELLLLCQQRSFWLHSKFCASPVYMRLCLKMNGWMIEWIHSFQHGNYQATATNCGLLTDAIFVMPFQWGDRTQTQVGSCLLHHDPPVMGGDLWDKPRGKHRRPPQGDTWKTELKLPSPPLNPSTLKGTLLLSRVFGSAQPLLLVGLTCLLVICIQEQILGYGKTETRGKPSPLAPWVLSEEHAPV